MAVPQRGPRRPDARLPLQPLPLRLYHERDAGQQEARAERLRVHEGLEAVGAAVLVVRHDQRQQAEREQREEELLQDVA